MKKLIQNSKFEALSPFSPISQRILWLKPQKFDSNIKLDTFSIKKATIIW